MTPAERTAAWRLVPGNADRERATKAAYKAAHPAEWKAQKAASSARYASAHEQEMRNKRIARREQLRAQVIEAYGGRCNCPGCHVVHAELLTVDHVNGDGHHRLNRRSTRDIYLWIIRHGFPPEFQLLCGSCNLAKSDRDKCPLAGEDH